MFLLFALACSTPPPAAPLTFVRGGALAPDGAAEGRAVGGGRVLVERAWTPGEQVTVGDASGVAPRQPECVALFHVDLGDISRVVAMGGAFPTSAVAFSPAGGDRVAVGTQRGEVIVADGWTGDVLARRTLDEAIVKHVVWSEDGRTLYVGEQSPDAWLYALDAQTLEARWTLRLADQVGSSPAPDAEDLYGAYTLPGVYGLDLLPGGDLLVAPLHQWTDGDGARLNRSVVLRVSPSGAVLDAWPDEPADATIKHPAIDAAGGLVALSVNRSADGAPPDDLPIGGLAVLDLATLELVGSAVAEPLKPWFQDAYVWEAVDVSRAQGAIMAGYGDGRVQVTGLDGAPRLSLDAGAPIMAGDVPIHASVGWGLLFGDEVVFNTSNTHIPWGAASPDLRPPSAHPSENTLFAVGLDGQTRWTWSGEHLIQGLTLGEDGQHLLVGAGARQTDRRRDLYGALIFDLGDPAAPDDRGGEARLDAVCPTAGPVFFRHALAADGRAAVVEFPIAEEDGSVTGTWRLTVLR